MGPSRHGAGSGEPYTMVRPGMAIIERFLKICEDCCVHTLTFKSSIHKKMARQRSIANLISLAPL